MKINKIKAGDVFPINDGGSVTVVEYRNAHEVLIEHNDSHKHRAAVWAHHLRNGQVKNPYTPSVYGVGYIGVGYHKVKNNGKNTAAYASWAKMLARCYSPEHLVRYPTYIGCSVHPDWHNFQAFAEWFYLQPNSDNQGFHLDKDLLVLDNKLYSAETCSFVPSQINTLLGDCGAARGRYPQGVCAYRKGYMAQLKVNGKQLYLGTYSSPEQAYAVYKKAKEENVRSMAVEWKDWLHPTVYANLMEWELQA